MRKKIRYLKNISKTSLAVKGISDDAYEKKAAISFVILRVNVNKLYQELIYPIINQAVKNAHLILNDTYFKR